APFCPSLRSASRLLARLVIRAEFGCCVSHVLLVARDVVAVEDAARSVAGEFHRDEVGHPCAHEVSDRRPPHIVNQSAGTACFLRGCRPCFFESGDRLRLLGTTTTFGNHPKEHPRDDLSAVSLRLISDRSLAL